MRGLALFAVLLYSALILVLPSVALAQLPPDTAPIEGTQHIDGNGVDIIKGTYNVSQLDVSIGPSGPGGLAVTHYDLLYPFKDNFVGTLNMTGSTANVWVGAVGDYFTTVPTVSGTSTNSAYGTGAALYLQTNSSTGGTYYVYKTMDGTQYVFNDMPSEIAPVANTGLLAQIIYPSGETLTVTYAPYVYTVCTVGGGCSSYGAYRRQSITSNTGYQLIYAYAADTIANNGTPSPDYWNWRTITKVTLINSAQQYYDPSANGSGFTGTQPDGLPWPSVSYTTVRDGSGSISSVTQTAADGGTWVFTANPSSNGVVTSVQTPTNSSATLSISYNAALQVQSYSNGFNSWTYSYSDSGSIRTTTVTDTSNNSTTVYTSNTALYQLLSAQDALGHTTLYSYNLSGNGQGMLDTVTYPEGNYVQYSYDSLQNVIQTLQVPKPGSGLANITSSATYPTSCSNSLVCHKPLTTTDPLGNVTYYTYDPNSGNVTNITQPAGDNGIRPQTNFAYKQISAGVMTSSGTLAAAAPVYRLTTRTTCATAPTATDGSCTGSSGNADQILTSINYPPSGAAGNLLPISVSTGAGDHSLTAATSMAYDSIGNVLSLTDPLSYTTAFRYDAMRRRTGVALPQLSSGVYRAATTIYNLDGTPAVVAQGTLSSSDWSSFSSLQQENTLYDTLGRKIQDTASGGGSTLAMTQYSYDPEGRLSCAARRMNTAVFGAPPASACSLGPQGAVGPDRITQYGYYADNHMNTVTVALGTSNQITTRTLTYNPNGTTHTIADGKGNLTTYAYDGFDRLADMYFPLASNGSVSSTTDYEQYGYDAAGHLLQRQLRDGSVIGFNYDALGRSTQKVLTAGTTTYGYDNLGRTLSVTAAGQTVGFAYDALGRQTSESGPLGTVSSQYDLDGTGAAASDLAAFASKALGVMGAVLSLSGDTPQFLYHYTTAAGFAGISSSGVIRPSSDGFVYLTPDVYAGGAAAQASLALNNTPIGYFEIPIRNASPMNSPSIVAPAYGQPGGGLEIAVPHPVSITGATWRSIGP